MQLLVQSVVEVYLPANNQVEAIELTFKKIFTQSHRRSGSFFLCSYCLNKTFITQNASRFLPGGNLYPANAQD